MNLSTVSVSFPFPGVSTQTIARISCDPSVALRSLISLILVVQAPFRNLLQAKYQPSSDPVSASCGVAAGKATGRWRGGHRKPGRSRTRDGIAAGAGVRPGREPAPTGEAHDAIDT